MPHHTHSEPQEPFLRDDEPILPRLSPSNARTLAAMILACGSVIGTFLFMQNQLSDGARRLEALELRIRQNEAADHVRDSIIIEINAERRREVYPLPNKPVVIGHRAAPAARPSDRAPELWALRHLAADPSRHERDHTAVEIAEDVPINVFDDPVGSGGSWSNFDTLHPRDAARDADRDTALHEH